MPTCNMVFPLAKDHRATGRNHLAALMLWWIRGDNLVQTGPWVEKSLKSGASLRTVRIIIANMSSGVYGIPDRALSTFVF